MDGLFIVFWTKRLKFLKIYHLTWIHNFRLLFDLWRTWSRFSWRVAGVYYDWILIFWIGLLGFVGLKIVEGVFILIDRVELLLFLDFCWEVGVCSLFAKILCGYWVLLLVGLNCNGFNLHLGLLMFSCKHNCNRIFQIFDAELLCEVIGLGLRKFSKIYGEINSLCNKLCPNGLT